jgi:hypothetical protein
MKAKKINCLICQKECFSGKRNLCDYHYNLELKEKEKAKLKKLKTKEKAKVKAEKKRAVITEKKLDTIFSKLVRTVYDPFCKACGKPIEFNGSHNAHLVSRKVRCVRWDLRNCYNTCPSCNLYDQLHVIYLAKKQELYYNIKVEDWINLTKQNICKLNNNDKERLYNVFTDYYEKAFKLNRGSYKLKESFELINEVIDLTKLIN